MTPKAAASTLYDLLSRNQWLVSVGVSEEDGRQLLVVYTNRRSSISRTLVPHEWEGYPVVLRQLGQIRPGSNSTSSSVLVDNHLASPPASSYPISP